MANALVVSGFGGGIVLNTSTDNQQTNELQEADGCDIGAREQLVSGALASGYTNVLDTQGTPTQMDVIYGLAQAKFVTQTVGFAIGMGQNFGVTDSYFATRFDPATEGATVAAANTTALPGLTSASAIQITSVAFPYVDKSGAQLNPVMLCYGARLPDYPNVSNTRVGIAVMIYSGGAWTYYPIAGFDSLGTGPQGEFLTGTKSKPLWFRGIAAYNNHVFGWGFDDADTTNKDGPNRLMFSNVGNPLKWGNDNLAATGTDRSFSDTDAINVGGAGEAITCCYASQGKLWIGTNRGLHYLAGYGRDSFITDGTTGVAKSLDVIGPHAMHEGPDGLLYGISSRGIWVLINGKVEHLYRNLVNPNRQSPGFWDLIWYDSSRAAGYPGKTNADLVWMLADEETQQIWTVIPFCDSTAGYGYGTDTVIIKYHTETGGFTRQVITGVCLTQGMLVKRGPANPETILMGNAKPTPTTNIYHYAYRSTPTTSPASDAMTVTFGEYAPFGPDGVGICRNVYLTIAWENTGVLPITATLTPSVDSQALTAVVLTVKSTAPAGPANGDLWLDTSATDTNIGNATAGTLIPATADYLLKRYVTGWSKWVIVARADGSQGTRATIPVAITPTRGTRVKLRCAIAGSGRISIETLGLSPATIRAAQ